MSTTTTNTANAWTPETIGELLVQPLQTESVAARIGLFKTGLSGDKMRFPVVTADPSAAWVDEGEEIPVSNATLDEVDVPFKKVAGLTIISRELAEDSSPSAADEIGRGLVRDIARKVDIAMFRDAGAKAPAGLAQLKGYTQVEAPADLADLDPYISARFRAAAVGAELAAYVLSPADAEALALVKESSTSAKRLLTESAGLPGSLAIDGIPVVTSPALTDGISWAIPKDSLRVGVRQDAQVDVDHSAFFTSDRVAVRGTMRVAFGFGHPKAVVQIVRPGALVAG